MTLGIVRVGQHTQISKLKHSDRALTWIHLAYNDLSMAFIVLVQLNYVVAPRIGFLRRI